MQKNKHAFMDHFHRALDEEQARQDERHRLEEEHLLKMKLKQEEKDREAKASEQARFEKQKNAMEKAKKLTEMRQKWVQEAPAATLKATKGDKKKGKAAGKIDELDIVDWGSSDEDESKIGISREKENEFTDSAHKEDFDSIFGKDDVDSEEVPSALTPNGFDFEEVGLVSFKNALKREAGDAADDARGDLADHDRNAKKARIVE